MTPFKQVGANHLISLAKILHPATTDCTVKYNGGHEQNMHTQRSMLFHAVPAALFTETFYAKLHTHNIQIKVITQLTFFRTISFVILIIILPIFLKRSNRGGRRGREDGDKSLM